MTTSSAPLIVGLLPSGMEWVWVLLIILLLFGGAKLPSLARGFGQSIKEFKKAQKDDEPETPPAAKTAASADNKTSDKS